MRGWGAADSDAPTSSRGKFSDRGEAPHAIVVPMASMRGSRFASAAALSINQNRASRSAAVRAGRTTPLACARGRQHDRAAGQHNPDQIGDEMRLAGEASSVLTVLTVLLFTGWVAVATTKATRGWIDGPYHAQGMKVGHHTAWVARCHDASAEAAEGRHCAKMDSQSHRWLFKNLSRHTHAHTHNIRTQPQLINFILKFITLSHTSHHSILE